MLPSHSKFHHPYDPYEIQLQFMRNLYTCIENGHLGIFESPTGTGKSLSLICAALTWLRDHESHLFDANFVTNPDQDWLTEAENNTRRRALLDERQEVELRLKSIRDGEVEQDRRDIATHHRVSKKRRYDHEVDQEELILDDYNSDKEKHPEQATDHRLSQATRVLLEQLQPQNVKLEAPEPEHRTKIIFCSRTHSQLSQFIGELKKLNLQSDNDTLPESIKQISLGSRKSLCINSKVSQLSSTTAINQRCLELQKPGLAKENKCSYLPNRQQRHDRGRIQSFREYAISTVRDIEDIAELGRKMKICPYYGSREVIPSAEIVTLPYPLLLQKSARAALGIEVKDNIVIIDEAHNLMDAIADTLSLSLPLSHMKLAYSQLMGYCHIFKSRLKGKNRVYIAQLIRLLKSCVSHLEQQDVSVGQQVAVSASHLISMTGADQIQPYKLVKYLQESMLVYKIEGYAELVEREESSLTSVPHDQSSRPTAVLARFSDLLTALMSPDAEGRFFIARTDSDRVLQYILLDPEQHFRDVVESARAVILAGGTMSPMSDYSEHLFAYVDPARLKCYSFNHVIGQRSVLVEPMSSGPSGIKFDFTFTNKSNETMISELGLLVEHLSRLVPDGLVIFFPSYDYLAIVTSNWRRTKQSDSIFNRISAHKRIFEESRTTDTDELLASYSAHIASQKGALLLAVVNGKLSEGINFSDALGRCVVCVGLPYPNIRSAEFAAKIEHVSERKREKLKSDGATDEKCKMEGERAGRDYTDNITMRAVNQSIGRAIRHKDDYAAIVLVDRRYQTERIQSRLPGWLRRSLCDHTQEKNSERCEERIRNFFLEKQNQA